jgi:uncharacterized delta-60 repeat protein
LARLNADGSLDASFDVGSGADDRVWAVALLPGQLGAQRVLIAGDFTHVQGVPRGGLAVLNPDGSLDPLFNPGAGANGTVHAVAVQTNGQIIVAGAFTEIDGRRRVRIARLNGDGTLDATFDPGLGANDSVYAVKLQPDGRAVIGGVFTRFNGTRRLGLARLRFNGTLDTSFMDTAYNHFAGLINNFSFESPNHVNSIALQDDGNLIIGGSFTQVGGNPSYRAPLRNRWTVFTRADKQPRYNVARIMGGSTPGPGNADFERSEYAADENGGVISVKLERRDGRLGSLLAQSVTEDNVALAGQDYGATNLFTIWPEAYSQTNFPLGLEALTVTNSSRCRFWTTPCRRGRRRSTCGFCSRTAASPWAANLSHWAERWGRPPPASPLRTTTSVPASSTSLAASSSPMKTRS